MSSSKTRRIVNSGILSHSTLKYLINIDVVSVFQRINQIPVLSLTEKQLCTKSAKFGEGCTHKPEAIYQQHISIQKNKRGETNMCKCELTCYFFGAEVDPSGEEDKEKREGEQKD